MLKTETRICVRYAETERMGIVHHSNYAVWFEEARTDFFHQLGESYAQVEEAGVFLPLTDLSCSYKRPAVYEQEIIVQTRVVRATCVRLRFAYEVRDAADHTLIATGRTDHAWTDTHLRPINLMRRMPEVYALIEGCIQEEGA